MSRTLASISTVLIRVLGAVFILSAAAKAVEINAFYIQIAYYGVARTAWMIQAAAVASIAIEILLGSALLLGLTMRGWTLRTVLALLIAFTGLILYGWIFKDLEECGCFGAWVKMTPLASTIKNLIMIAAVGVAWFGRRGLPTRTIAAECAGAFRGVAQRTVAIVAVVLIVSAVTVGWRRARAAAHGPDTAQIASVPVDAGAFARYRFTFEETSYDLGEGDYFIALLSDSCPHCEDAVEQLHELRDWLSEDLPPIVGLCLGDRQTLGKYRKLTQPRFPTALIPPLDFFGLIGEEPPRFYLVRDGRAIQDWDLYLPDPIDLFDLLQEMQSGEMPPTDWPDESE